MSHSKIFHHSSTIKFKLKKYTTKVVIGYASFWTKVIIGAFQTFPTARVELAIPGKRKFNLFSNTNSALCLAAVVGNWKEIDVVSYFSGTTALSRTLPYAQSFFGVKKERRLFPISRQHRNAFLDYKNKKA